VAFKLYRGDEDMVHATVYVSFLVEGWDESQLEKILSVARRKNPSLNITGCLVYRNGVFIQLLEGEKSAVDSLVAVIRKDGRHDNFTILFNGPTEARMYADWSMAYVEGREISFDFMNEVLSMGASLARPDGKKYLEEFKRLARVQR
jgi:hypothetical protein